MFANCCRVGPGALVEPFFDQSIERIVRNKRGCSQSMALEALASASGKAPSGFIFHVSRCGSTLLSQLLASVPGVAVFAEPAVIEAVLRGAYRQGGGANEEKIGLLRTVVGAFASHAAADAVFIKFTARAIVDYPLISQAYPDVPCIFVYRDPTEVIVSLVGNDDSRLPPGLSEAGLLCDAPETIRAMRPAEFWARVVASQCAAGADMSRGSRWLLVDYGQLPQAVWVEIAKFLGVAFGAADIERMQRAAARSAKNSELAFFDDRSAKRAAASAEIQAWVDRLVRPHYERLESLRTAFDTSDNAESP